MYNDQLEDELEIALKTVASLRAELEAVRRERDEATALADWYHRTNNDATEKVWAVLVREPHREGGENLVGRVTELKSRVEAAEAERDRLQAEVKHLRDALHFVAGDPAYPALRTSTRGFVAAAIAKEQAP